MAGLCSGFLGKAIQRREKGNSEKDAFYLSDLVITFDNNRIG